MGAPPKQPPSPSPRKPADMAELHGAQQMRLAIIRRLVQRARRCHMTDDKQADTALAIAGEVIGIDYESEIQAVIREARGDDPA